MEKAIELLEKFVEYHEAKEANRRDRGNHFDIWMKWHTISREFEGMMADAKELIASASQKPETSDEALPIGGVGGSLPEMVREKVQAEIERSYGKFSTMEEDRKDYFYTMFGIIDNALKQ